MTDAQKSVVTTKAINVVVPPLPLTSALLSRKVGDRESLYTPLGATTDARNQQPHTAPSQKHKHNCVSSRSSKGHKEVPTAKATYGDADLVRLVAAGLTQSTNGSNKVVPCRGASVDEPLPQPVAAVCTGTSYADQYMRQPTYGDASDRGASDDALPPMPTAVRSSRSTANTPRNPQYAGTQQRPEYAAAYNPALFAQTISQELGAQTVSQARGDARELKRTDAAPSAHLRTPREPNEKEPRHERHYGKQRIKNRFSFRQVPPVSQPAQQQSPQTARAAIQSLPREPKKSRGPQAGVAHGSTGDCTARSRNSILVKFLDSLKVSLGWASHRSRNEAQTNTMSEVHPSGAVTTRDRSLPTSYTAPLAPEAIVSQAPFVVLPPAPAPCVQVVAQKTPPPATTIPAKPVHSATVSSMSNGDCQSIRVANFDESPASPRMAAIPSKRTSGDVKATHATPTSKHHEVSSQNFVIAPPTSVDDSTAEFTAEVETQKPADSPATSFPVPSVSSLPQPRKTSSRVTSPGQSNFYPVTKKTVIQPTDKPLRDGASGSRNSIKFSWRVARPILRMRMQPAETFSVLGVPFSQWSMERIPTLGASPTSCRVQEMSKAAITPKGREPLRVFVKRVPISLWNKQYEAQNRWNGEYVTDGENFVMEAAALAFMQEYRSNIAPALLGILEQCDTTSKPADSTQLSNSSSTTSTWQNRLDPIEAKSNSNVTHIIIVSELYGEDLLDFLDRREKDNRPLQPHEKHRLQCECLVLLRRLHSLGFAHLDFTPENVLYGPNGLRLCDFAKATPLWTYHHRHVQQVYGRPLKGANSNFATWFPFESCEPTVGKGAYMPPECWKVYWELEETKVQFPLEELWTLQNPNDRTSFYFRVSEADVYMLGVLMFWIWSEGGIWKCSDPRQDEKYYHLLKSGLNFDLFRECRSWPVELKDFLQKVLRPEPLRRATIDELLNHVWFRSCGGVSTLLAAGTSPLPRFEEIPPLSPSTATTTTSTGSPSTGSPKTECTSPSRNSLPHRGATVA